MTLGYKYRSNLLQLDIMEFTANHNKTLIFKRRIMDSLVIVYKLIVIHNSVLFNSVQKFHPQLVSAVLDT